MNKFRVLLSFTILVILIFSACQQQKETDVLDIVKGVSQEIATHRKQHYSDIKYQLLFDIPASRNEEISSQGLISLFIDEITSTPLLIDFNEQTSHLKKLNVNGQEIEIQHENEHIIIASKYLKEGENTIEIDFTAGELSLNRNDDFLYTLLVPDRASTLFPCFDQPDLKSSYQLSIKVPTTWNTLANSKLNNTEKDGDKIVYHFSASDKMSTYLFSFVAGVFNKETQNLGHFEMTLLHREDDEERIEESTDELFNIHEASLSFLEEYTNYDFPFQKFDFATIPGFQYGGMEHVGAIQYRQSSLFLNKSATQSQKLGRARLIAHETAHMWFGDLVTMKWFNDVWMKEVFANFMADKIVNPNFPEINHKLQFLTAHYPSAYSEDRTKGATPIRQQLDNLKNAGTLYGRIIYNKAPIMMRQLEALIGEEAFKEGVREYISTYAHKNADWPELITILNTKTNTDLNAWSDVWVNQSGRPKFTYQLETFAENRIGNFVLIQQAEDGTDKLWPQVFDVALVYKDSVETITVHTNTRRLIIEEVNGKPIPEKIIFNYNGLGYGIFPVNKEHIAEIPQIQDPVARAHSYLNIYENMLDGTVAPKTLIHLLKEAVLEEKEELILSLISGQLQTIFWTFTEKADREEFIDAAEPLFRQALQKKLPANIKRTLYNTYRNIAYNDAGKVFLYSLWNKEKSIEGLTLSSNDYTQLAANLVIFKHKEWETIIENTAEAITNVDRKKRFQFLSASLSNNEDVRDTFFESLKKAENREKEAWVLTALGYLNHPLRSKNSEKYITSSLELLEEIQLTGDIFFPKGWLNNTVGRFSSKKAYDDVQYFLEANPDLNPVLKAKLLQAADPLFRAQKIKV